MLYREFMEEAEKGVRERLGKETTVTRDRVRKNNAVFLDALFIREKGERISPVLYLQDFYRKYQAGMDMDTVLDEMISCYMRGKCAMEVDVSFFTDPMRVKKRVFPRLVNWSKNREALMGVPHREFQDLAIVYYCVLERSSFGDAAILIREEHRSMWGMREEDLYNAGRENLYRSLPWVFLSMEDMLVSMLGDMEEAEGTADPAGGTLSDQERILKTDGLFERAPDGREDGGYPFPTAQSIIAEQKASPVPLYVLTNEKKSFGAVWITEDEVLKEVGEKLGEDYYVLPSSVHECIILPVSVTDDSMGLRRMVEDINSSQVAPEEVLSDSIYFYDRSAKSLSVLQQAR